MKERKGNSLLHTALVVCVTGIVAVFNGADWLRTAVFSGGCILGMAAGDRIAKAKRRKNPEFIAEWEALEPEFEKKQAKIDAGIAEYDDTLSVDALRGILHGDMDARQAREERACSEVL